jgi:hypothetical protein
MSENPNKRRPKDAFSEFAIVDEIDAQIARMFMSDEDTAVISLDRPYAVSSSLKEASPTDDDQLLPSKLAKAFVHHRRGSDTTNTSSTYLSPHQQHAKVPSSSLQRSVNNSFNGGVPLPDKNRSSMLMVGVGGGGKPLQPPGTSSEKRYYHQVTAAYEDGQSPWLKATSRKRANSMGNGQATSPAAAPHHLVPVHHPVSRTRSLNNPHNNNNNNNSTTAAERDPHSTFPQQRHHHQPYDPLPRARHVNTAVLNNESSPLRRHDSPFHLDFEDKATVAVIANDVFPDPPDAPRPLGPATLRLQQELTDQPDVRRNSWPKTQRKPDRVSKE